jgi:predicted DNA-binding transcriptional regulator AlpA
MESQRMIENKHSADSAAVRSDEAMLISADDLAHLLGVSKRQIWRLRSRGDLIEPIKIGSTTRWPLDAVREWIAVGCPRPNAHSDKTNYQ